MRQLKNYDEVKNYVLANAQDGTFSQSYKMIADGTHSGNLATVRNHLLRMVSEGLLEVKRESKRGMGGSGVYRIKKPMDDYITIEFKGVEILLKRIDDYGYCIKKSDLELATISDDTLVDKIVASNKPLFEGEIVDVNGVQYFTKRAILHFITKLNVSNSLPLKQEVLVDFQNMIVSKMLDTIRGAVSWNESDGIRIKHTLSDLMDISIEDVNKVFHDIEEDLNKIFTSINGKLHVCEAEVGKYEKKINRLSNELENEKRKVQGYITEKTHLQEQLLSRQ